jgi:hypothetical protein
MYHWPQEPVHASATTKSRQCSTCNWILTVVILGMAGWMLLDLEVKAMNPPDP